MINHPIGIKKGEQLSMSIGQSESSPNILNKFKLKAIDIRSDWKSISSTIKSNSSIQKLMEESYQDFQEGFKIKDFKHPNVNGPWNFSDINKGIFPYMLTTSDWLKKYEANEWIIQATKHENELKLIIDKAIDKCKNLEDLNTKITTNLDYAKINLLDKYSPRPNQPETWRPQNAAHWSSIWMKLLAEIHYKNLTSDWRIIESNSHSIVAGFLAEGIAYLLDIVLLTTDTNKILNKLKD
jgi:hypothetical protein